MKLQLMGVLFSLLLATPSLARYLPSLDIDGQINSSKSGYEQRALSLISTTPLVHNKFGMLFSDIRLSNGAARGLHLGLGARRKVKAVTVGLHNSYDIYDTKNDYRQFVTGLEVLNPTVEMRATLYQPNETERITYKNYEGEFAVKLKGVFVGLNTYRMVDHGDKYDGTGIKLKYENKGKKRWSLYFSAGYQYDELYEHQFSTNFGIKITAGSNNKGENEPIPHIERDMKLYRTAIDDRFLAGAFGGLFGNANILLADQGNYRELFKNSEKGDVIVIDRDLEVGDTITLKEGQKLYGRSYLNGKKDKLERVSFADGSGKPEILIDCNNNTTVAGLELNDRNMIHEAYGGLFFIGYGMHDIKVEGCKIISNITDMNGVLLSDNYIKNVIISGNTFYAKDSQWILRVWGYRSNINVKNNTVYFRGHKSDFYHVSYDDGHGIVSGNNIIFENPDNKVIGFNYGDSDTYNFCEAGATCKNYVTIKDGLTDQEIQKAVCDANKQKVAGKVEFVVNGGKSYFCPQ